MLEREEFGNHIQEVINWVKCYFENITNFTVKSQVKPGEILSSIEENAPIEGTNQQNILAEISEKLIPGITHWQHPNFHAYFPANSSVESIYAEIITAAIGAQCMIWETSPAAAELEERVLNWLANIMSIPSDWEGAIQDTASTATLAAILTAREVSTNFTSNLKGVPKNLRVYCTTQTHSSIEKAVAIAGIGSQNLVKVEVDGENRMKSEALEKAINTDLEEGYIPICIVSAMGTTGTLAIDPIEEISLLAKKYGLWHHIDAAYAGTALLLPEYQWMIAGIQDANSFVFNPHKWMFTNFDCTVYYVKDASLLIKTFEILPEYLKTKTRGQVNDYRDWGIPLGRRFRALKLWWVIKSYGIKGLQEKLRKHIQLRIYFTSQIESRLQVKYLTSPILNFCCLQFIPHGTIDQEIINQVNQRIMERINTSGLAYVSHTMVGNQLGIRFVFGNTYLEKKHVDNLIKILVEKTETVFSQYNY